MRLMKACAVMMLAAAPGLLCDRPAEAVVICQKARKLRLRPTCTGKEVEVTLSPHSVLKALEQVDGLTHRWFCRRVDRHRYCRERHWRLTNSR